MPKLLEFLTEENGRMSSMRLIAMLWSLGTLAVWMSLSLKKGEMIPIDPTALGGMAVGIVGKVSQKFAENPPKLGRK